MGAAYGEQGGLPIWHMQAIAAGQPVRTRWDPIPYSPIHDDDIQAQLEPLLDAASVPATIVNWAGDEPVSVQEWCAYFGELLGVEAKVVVKEIPGASRGSVADPDQAPVDHRSGARVLEGRFPPHGRVLPRRRSR